MRKVFFLFSIAVAFILLSGCSGKLGKALENASEPSLGPLDFFKSSATTLQPLSESDRPPPPPEDEEETSTDVPPLSKNKKEASDELPPLPSE